MKLYTFPLAPSPQRVTLFMKEKNIEIPVEFFAILDQQLANNEYIAGEKFSVADITAFVAIKFSAWVKVEVSEQYVHLHRWFKQLSSKLSD